MGKPIPVQVLNKYEQKTKLLSLKMYLLYKEQQITQKGKLNAITYLLLDHLLIYLTTYFTNTAQLAAIIMDTKASN